MKNLLIGAALCALAWSGPALADDLEEEAARFGIRATVLSVSLSPSGEKIAFISSGPEHSEVLNVVDLAGDGQVRVVTRNSEQNGDLTRCEWATDTRLVCQLYGIGKGGGLLLGFTRMFAIDYDGQNGQLLTERASPVRCGLRSMEDRWSRWKSTANRAAF
jgi:Tol biopolymer transport system component